MCLQRFARAAAVAACRTDGDVQGDFVTWDVTRTYHGTVPNRTVQYRTVSCCAVGTDCSEALTLSLSKKAKGKESRCGKPAELWKTLWKDCGKLEF